MPLSIEKIGIEHIPNELRHGKPFSVLTLWFAANLTVADFALGGLLKGMGPGWAAIVIIVGNLLGGTLLGLMATMGPSFGYPQMIISQTMFGRVPNILFAILNWLSTVGWFTVNIILGGKALHMLGVPFLLGVTLLTVIQVFIAVYGHDFIHLFEKAMSVVLGIMFLIITITSIKHGITLHQHSPSSTYVIGMIAVVFSYLMSWSPYASDYSRYLPKKTSKLKLFLYTLLGGAIASAWLEFIGYLISSKTSLGPIASMPIITGRLAPLALLAIVLGVVTANSLNLYTNSLSALVVYNKANRKTTVLLAAAIGFALCIAGASNFEHFYSDFLITLDYWITPWIGVMVAMFFFKKTKNTNSNVVWRGLASYIIGLVASIPFMNLTYYGIPYEGAVAKLMSGSDISYFVSFFISFMLASLIPGDFY